MEHQLNRSQRRRRFAAALLAATLCGGALIALPYPAPLSSTAEALEYHHGPGVNWGNGVHINGAGAFIIDGKYVYCAEPWVRSGTALPTFVGGSTIPANSSDGVSVAETTGAPLRQISFLMTRYGQTNDNLQAAAVALAIWEVRGADGRGNGGYERQMAQVRRSVGPEVIAAAAALMNEASAWVAASASGNSPVDTPEVSVDPADPYRGVVSVPTGTLALTIENGVFSDGATSREWGGSGAAPGTSLSWEGRPPAAGWDKYYRVQFSGNYLEVSSTVQWGDGQGWQGSVTHEEPRVAPLKAAYAAPDTSWAPQVSSLVTSRFVQVGEPHSDDVIFSATPASSGRSGTWRWRLDEAGNKQWMPVKARVTAYGPFLTDPALNPSPEAPVGAPVAATGTFTTDAQRDHSTAQTYSYVFDQPIAEQGYYTYKWDIDGNDQDPSIAGLDDCTSPNVESGCRILPKNYFVSDGFGAAGETQIGTMDQSFTTKLSTHDLALADTFTDTISLPRMHNWLRDDSGARLPLTLTGTAYLVSGPELAQSADVPATAVAFGTTKVTTDPGKNEQELVSAALMVPVDAARHYQHVTMRWCIVDADQEPRARGFWNEKCDDFGVPDESATLSHPEVRTEATPLGTVHDSLSDTAIVNGRVPANSNVVFDLYRQPDGAAEPVCTPDNLITRTSPVPVTAGENKEERYVSPEVSVTNLGTYWWVEHLIHTDPATASETVLQSGACGLPNETSIVEAPSVTTLASETVFVDDEARDTAFVSGPVPGAASGVRSELTFQAFKQQGDAVSCTAENVVFDLRRPVVVQEAGEYVSEPVRFTEAGTYFWVETLSYVFESGEREVVHVGECGLPNETTKVKDRPVLAFTGADGSWNSASWALAGMGGVLIMAGATVLIIRLGAKRKQQNHATSMPQIRECDG